MKIHSTTTTDFVQDQVLKNAHPLGTHHIAISRNHTTLVSVGFGGEARIWRYASGMWNEVGDIPAAKKAGELWAVALDSAGKYLVGTTYDGRVNVWELVSDVNEKSGAEKVKAQKFAEWETRGGYGLAVDVVSTLSYLFTSAPFPIYCTDNKNAVTRQRSDGDITSNWQHLHLQHLNNSSPTFSTHTVFASTGVSLLPR